MIFANWVGAFFRWLLKGCKTKLRDEIDGNFEGTFIKDYETENIILGILGVGILFAIGFAIADFFW